MQGGGGADKGWRGGCGCEGMADGRAHVVTKVSGTGWIEGEDYYFNFGFGVNAANRKEKNYF